MQTCTNSYGDTQRHAPSGSSLCQKQDLQQHQCPDERVGSSRHELLYRGFVSSPDGYSSEPLHYYDMLTDPMYHPLQDPDLQLLPYSPQQQYSSGFCVYSPASSSSPSPTSSSSLPCPPLHHYSPPTQR
ncbi:hypothetical protein WMY93_027970 [Mugilogobius chulae]|uniref:Uncharacterized protein n=1 Tax=Mugilogobius chulae TaxID=88201 RepID=A0AAW0N6C5_9GOBI